ncbi:hypothetical protein BX600DRAFT_459547 [Xylariales sp. PMI_506]|nr:hypothetical protein BX600DRAFT_459547 [Xylariales sp. PMI_506]
MAAVKPRKRACDSCYQRKIQCDGDTPPCDWCRHHAIACTFNRLPMKPGRAARTKTTTRTAHKNSIAGSSSQATHLSPAATPTPQGSSPDTAATSARALNNASPACTPTGSQHLGSYPPIAPLGEVHFAGNRLGEINPYTGLPSFSADGERWIQERTGEVSSFPQTDISYWKQQRYAYSSTNTMVTGDPKLPERDYTEAYFSMYCSNHLRFVFPVVDPVLFRQTIDSAYQLWNDGEPVPAEVIGNRACVLLFVAFISIMEGVIESAPVNAAELATEALSAIQQVLLSMNLIGLQVVTMQYLINLFTGDFQTATLFLSLSCRMVFMLGGHTDTVELSPEAPDDEFDMPWLYKTQLRKLFWLCYSFDKDLSLRTGHPAHIDDDHCDLSLPKSYEHFDGGMPDFNNERTMFFPGDLRLSIIKSKAIKLLYSVQARRKTDAELLRDIRELDDQLEQWRQVIHPRFRPSLASQMEDASSMGPSASIPQKMHTIIVNFEYHHIMAGIHQATGRCRAWAQGERGKMEGVSSSLALSLKASRSTLRDLRVACNTLRSESFWMVLFYPMSAILTVFFSILLDPLHAQVEEDIEIIRSVPTFLNRIRVGRLTPGEILHGRLIEEFIVELIRLGTCAIQKARNDAMMNEFVLRSGVLMG